MTMDILTDGESNAIRATALWLQHGWAAVGRF
jgi:hypothetical protein